MVADDQDGVPYRYRSLLRASPPFAANVLRTEVAPLGARRRVGRFGECSTQPLGAFGRLARAPLARRLVVARTHPGPRSEVPGSGKPAHVDAYLSDQILCRRAIYARDCVQNLYLLLKMGDHPLDLGTKVP